jgi:peptidoglycan/xylan/chitin deacetylase (PgdA/CDA1 family)
MKAILTYHSIDDSGSPISVSPAAFDGHVRWLTGGRAKVLSLDGLLAHSGDEEHAVAVTFDDGFANTARPVQHLLDAGVPVTLFAVTGFVGGTNSWHRWGYPAVPTMPLLDWRGLEDLLSRGATIGSHTRSHRPLTTCSAARLDDELLGSREDLQAHLGVQSAHLSYPFGEVDAPVAGRASQCFRGACTTEFATLRDGADRIRLPRLDMYYFGTPTALDSWGTGSFRRRLTWIRTRRTLRARLTGPSRGRQAAGPPDTMIG